MSDQPEQVPGQPLFDRAAEAAAPADPAPDAPPPAPAAHVPLIDQIAGYEARFVAIEDRLTQLVSRYNTFVQDASRELGL